MHHSSAIPCRAARTHNRLFMCTVVKVKVSAKESTVWAWCVNVDKTFRPHARNGRTGYKGNHCTMGTLYLQIYHLYGAEDRHLLVHLHNVPGKPQLHSPIALERRCWTSWRWGRDEQNLKANGSELPRAVRDSSAIPCRAASKRNRLFVYTVVKSPLIGDTNASSVSKESTVWAWCVNVDKRPDRMQRMAERRTQLLTA